ncbi:MAG: hypothetical protein DCC56_10660 [Anaerolineae bacterium]|nr:MAG: hypothetical protein DCC56_10660 [Anaerolineae bacterium]
MSSEERKKILQLVEEGKISADDAASLMRALDDDVDDAEAEVEVIHPEAGSGFERSDASSWLGRSNAPEFDQVKARARRFALIPLWVGVIITVFSAWIIYAIQQSAGANFWFYCMILPLMLGVLLIALGSGGRASRWIYVDVDRRNAKPGDGPRHITLGFPAPLGFMGWFFSTFGQNIQGMGAGKGRAIAEMMEAARNSDEPLMVNVDDDDAQVQVYIG